MRVCFGLLVEVDGCKENLGVVVDFSAPRGTLLGRCLWRFPVNGYYEDIHLVLVCDGAGVTYANAGNCYNCPLHQKVCAS